MADSEGLLGALAALLARDEWTGIELKKLSRLRADLLVGLDQRAADARLATFIAGSSAPIEVMREALPTAAPVPDDRVPLAVHALQHVPDDVYSLPRFASQVGVLYRDRRGEALVPDPFLATGVVPALSACFHDHSASRCHLPTIDLSTCTGCGACWAACPDGALAAVALSPQALLEGGIEAANQAGRRADALRPMISKLSPNVAKAVAAAEQPTHLGALLSQPFAELLDRMNPAADRRAGLQAAFEAVADAVGEAPFARTDTFFSARAGGGGELLFLSVDPATCKDCGACATACEPGAITMVEQTPHRLTRARTDRVRWERLPDTPGPTVERAAEQVGPLSALLLSRACANAMVGGDAAPAGAGDRLSLRAVLAVAEGTLQPRVLGTVKNLQDQVAGVRDALQQVMSKALPADLSAVAQGLQQHHDKVDLAALAASVPAGFGKGLVNADHLRDLAQAGQRIDQLAQRLLSGPQGMGRSRYGIVLAESAALRWAAAFPDNPFAVPVQVVPGSHVAEVACGIAQAWCARAVEAARVTRWAKALLDSPTDATEVLAQPLSWSGLDEAERRLCPPVLLVGDASALEGDGLGDLAALMAADLPVKVVILDDLDTTVAYARELELLSMAGDRAYLVQTSPSHPAHLVPAVQAAFRHDGPAVIRLPALRPDRHGFGRDQVLVLDQLAVLCRAFPLLRYDPRQEGVFGTRLSLEGNPAPDQAQACDDQGQVYDVQRWAAPQERFSRRIAGRRDQPGASAAKRPCPLREGPRPHLANLAGTRGPGDALRRPDPGRGNRTGRRIGGSWNRSGPGRVGPAARDGARGSRGRIGGPPQEPPGRHGRCPARCERGRAMTGHDPLSSFRHGVHPSEHKDRTEGLATQRMPFPSRIILPLSQHIGGPAIPIVAVGDHVVRGQLIAKHSGFVSSPIHATVTGRVVELAPKAHPSGGMVNAIVLETDPYDDQAIHPHPRVDPSTLSPKEWVAHVQAGGLVGMGGAAFPTHVKYALPQDRTVKHLVVNGCECEPYLTCDHRTMLERPEDVVRGTQIAARHLGVEHTTVGIEANKADAIQALRAVAATVPAIEVRSLQVKYPQGAEKMLIKAIFGLEVPAGKLPLDLDMVVNNVGTMVGLTDWFDRGIPLVERVVTVSGPGVVRPANLLVPIGTSVREVLAFCGGLTDRTRTVVMGGPMMGMSLSNLDVPVLKGTSGLLAFTDEEAWMSEEYGCIRCGRCLEACPYFLNPSRLALLSRATRWEDMAGMYAMDCMECGACSYSCPSGIPIVQLIRVGKREIRKLGKKS